jgi:hypothetical protein
MGENTRDRPIEWRMNLALCLTALPWTSEKYLKFVRNAAKRPLIRSSSSFAPWRVRVLVLGHARRFALEDGERDGSERAELFFARFVDAVEMHL